MLDSTHHMKIASHGPEAIAGAVATFARKSDGLASLTMHCIGVPGSKNCTHLLLCERYGGLCTGKVHLKDYNGLCEWDELRGVELRELEVMQGQRGAS